MLKPTGMVILAALGILPLSLIAWTLVDFGAPPRAARGQLSEAQSKAAGGPAEDFKPPSREELEKVRWIERPCLDFEKHLRQALEQEPSPISEAEALDLRNTSKEDNQKLLRALGRLPNGESDVDWDATFDRWLGSDPTTLNPVFNSSRYETMVNELLYIMPLAHDWELKQYGDLGVIERWETSEDRLMDRVFLRRDLTWSDGKPFTAHDVEFTWKVIMDPRVRPPAVRGIASGLRGVKAYDERTVVYFQKEALATNSLNLSWFTIPSHIYQESWKEDPTLEASPFHVKMNSAPVTSGPYRVLSWQKQQEIVLERREEWHQGASGERIRAKPYFKRVRFRVLPDASTAFQSFRAGDLDDDEFDSIQWAQRTLDNAFYKTCTKVRGEEWQFAFIGWNAKSNPPNPFFGDKRVRLAMAYAFEHEFLLQDMYFGLYRAEEGIFHPDSWMACKELKPFHRDPDKAEQLLDEAGWKDTDGDGIRDKLIDGKTVPFHFTVSVPNAGSGPKVAELLRADLEKIGVKCDVLLIGWVEFDARLRERKHQAYMMALTTGIDPDTAKNLWETKAIQDGRNYVGYSNPAVDELFQKGRREFDPGKRAAIYAEIDRLIYEDHPVTMLFCKPTLWGFSKSIRGYRPSPRGFYGYSPGFFSMWKKKKT